MSTCQKEAYTISSNADSMPTPNNSTASGISATEGTGRKNSIVEFVNLRRNVEDPMITPNTAAATTEMTIPISQACMVSHTAIQKTESVNLLNKSEIAAEAGGRNLGSTMPSNGKSS